MGIDETHTNGSIVYIIDDDINFIEALKWVLENNEIDTECFTSCSDFIKCYNPDQQGCILSDIIMPSLDGVKILDFFNSHNIKTPVVLMTGYASISLAVEMMKEGAFDFIEKPINEDDLLKIINRAFGESEKIHKKIKIEKDNHSSLSKLTKREKEVFNLVVQGHSNKVTSSKLNITQKTVEAHRANIMKKTGSLSLSDLINLANQPGL